MSVLTKLLRESYDLQESKGDESAYWHLQKLREAIKSEQIKGETLPIDSVDYRRELLLTELNKVDRPLITLLEIADYERAADYLLGKL